MAITAGYGNTKFVDDAQVVRLWTLSAIGFFFFCCCCEKKKKTLVVGIVVVIISREMGSNSSRVSNSMRWKRDDDLFSKTHTPPKLGVETILSRPFLSLSLSLVDDDDRKITFFFFFSHWYLSQKQIAEETKRLNEKLRDSNVRTKLEGLKQLIAMMSTGRDVSHFSPSVVVNIVTDSFEVKALVYMFLVRTAEQNRTRRCCL